MANKQVIVPAIHLNGTSGDELLNAIDRADSALRGAYDELRKCAPNARDYYVYAAGAYGKAVDEHNARLRKLHDVMDELQAIAWGIEQGTQYSEVE